MKPGIGGVLSRLYSYFCIFTGAVLASFSVACILLPNDAIDYGTAGIAIIINKVTGFNLSLCVACVVIPFLVFGGVFLGIEFFIKALLGSAVYTVGLEVFENIPFELDTEHFLAVAFGGAILGFGLSLILRHGGCIDGSEILANIIVERISNRTGRNYSLSGILLFFNCMVYACAFIVINRTAALLSLLVYFVATFVTDHFTDRFESIKQVRIITKNPDDIIEYIRNDLKKTCTVIDSYGAVAGENKTIICFVNYFELQKFRGLVKKFENTAYITVSTIDEVIK